MNVSEAVKDFFTASSLVTFGGASLAIVALSNTWQRLSGLRPVWPAFIASLILTFGSAASVDHLHGFFAYVIAFFNACLLFSTAAGMQEATIATSPPPVAEQKTQPLGIGQQQGASATPGRQWRNSWFK